MQPQTNVQEQATTEISSSIRQQLQQQIHDLIQTNAANARKVNDSEDAGKAELLIERAQLNKILEELGQNPNDTTVKQAAEEIALDDVRNYIKKTRDGWLTESKLSSEAKAALARQFADDKIKTTINSQNIYSICISEIPVGSNESFLNLGALGYFAQQQDQDTLNFIDATIRAWVISVANLFFAFDGRTNGHFFVGVYNMCTPLQDATHDQQRKQHLKTITATLNQSLSIAEDNTTVLSVQMCMLGTYLMTSINKQLELDYFYLLIKMHLLLFKDSTLNCKLSGDGLPKFFNDNYDTKLKKLYDALNSVINFGSEQERDYETATNISRFALSNCLNEQGKYTCDDLGIITSPFLVTDNVKLDEAFDSDNSPQKESFKTRMQEVIIAVTDLVNSMETFIEDRQANALAKLEQIFTDAQSTNNYDPVEIAKINATAQDLISGSHDSICASIKRMLINAAVAIKNCTFDQQPPSILCQLKQKLMNFEKLNTLDSLSSLVQFILDNHTQLPDFAQLTDPSNPPQDADLRKLAQAPEISKLADLLNRRNSPYFLQNLRRISCAIDILQQPDKALEIINRHVETKQIPNALPITVVSLTDKQMIEITNEHSQQQEPANSSELIKDTNKQLIANQCDLIREQLKLSTNDNSNSNQAITVFVADEQQKQLVQSNLEHYNITFITDSDSTDLDQRGQAISNIASDTKVFYLTHPQQEELTQLQQNGINITVILNFYQMPYTTPNPTQSGQPDLIPRVILSDKNDTLAHNLELSSQQKQALNEGFQELETLLSLRSVDNNPSKLHDQAFYILQIMMNQGYLTDPNSVKIVRVVQLLNHYPKTRDFLCDQLLNQQFDDDLAQQPAQHDQLDCATRFFMLCADPKTGLKNMAVDFLPGQTTNQISQSLHAYLQYFPPANKREPNNDERVQNYCKELKTNIEDVFLKMNDENQRSAVINSLNLLVDSLKPIREQCSIKPLSSLSNSADFSSLSATNKVMILSLYEMSQTTVCSSSSKNKFLQLIGIHKCEPHPAITTQQIADLANQLVTLQQNERRAMQQRQEQAEHNGATMSA